MTDANTIQFSYLALNCALSALTGYLLYRSLEMLTKRRFWSFVGWGFYVVLVGLSRWIVAPYTDGIALPFPMLLFYLFVREFHNEAFRWFWMGVVGFAGYYIKPTALIMLMAILPFALLRAGTMIKRCAKTLLLSAAALLLGSALVIGGFKTVSKLAFGDAIDPDRNYGFLNFAAMGMNEVYSGMYNALDAADSDNAATLAERNAMNLEKLRSRLRLAKTEPRKMYRFLRRKIMINFSDGVFAFYNGADAEHISMPGTDGAISRFLRSLFYTDGERFHILATCAQIAWILALSATVFLLWPLRRDGIWRYEAVLALYLFGVFLYLLLFEARARYVFMNVPLFCVSASLGLRRLSERMRGRATRRRA